jgi:hypothetical protein
MILKKHLTTVAPLLYIPTKDHPLILPDFRCIEVAKYYPRQAIPLKGVA